LRSKLKTRVTISRAESKNPRKRLAKPKKKDRSRFVAKSRVKIWVDRNAPRNDWEERGKLNDWACRSLRGERFNTATRPVVSGTFGDGVVRGYSGKIVTEKWGGGGGGGG